MIFRFSREILEKLMNVIMFIVRVLSYVKQILSQLLTHILTMHIQNPKVIILINTKTITKGDSLRHSLFMCL